MPGFLNYGKIVILLVTHYNVLALRTSHIMVSVLEVVTVEKFTKYFCNENTLLLLNVWEHKPL